MTELYSEGVCQTGLDRTSHGGHSTPADRPAWPLRETSERPQKQIFRGHGAGLGRGERAGCRAEESAAIIARRHSRATFYVLLQLQVSGRSSPPGLAQVMERSNDVCRASGERGPETGPPPTCERRLQASLAVWTSNGPPWEATVRALANQVSRKLRELWGTGVVRAAHEGLRSEDRPARSSAAGVAPPGAEQPRSDAGPFAVGAPNAGARALSRRPRRRTNDLRASRDPRMPLIAALDRGALYWARGAA